MKNQTFGIEIETTGLSRKTVAEIIAKHYGTDAYYIGTGYDTYGAKTTDGREWKCMKDSSIINTGSGVCEIVSPILTYSDMEDLQQIVRDVREAGAKSSPRFKCGIHIHIGAQNHTVQSLKNLVNFMSSYQDIIYKAVKVDPYREDYCKKLSSVLIDKFNERGLDSIAKCETAWYGKGNEAYHKSQHYSNTRYYGLNLHSVFTKGTVEFRLFNGTLHAGEIRAYVVLCLAMSQFALDKKSVRRSKKNNLNDKYAMYNMLWSIGVVGDEFKNCREHLMKHLSGSLKTTERRVNG